MAPRLSGQTSIFGVVFFISKSLLGIEGQKKLEKFAILTRKPRSHARILIYRTWPIILKLINYSCSSYLTRASYSGQVDEFRNPMKTELKTRPCLKAVFQII